MTPEQRQAIAPIADERTKRTRSLLPSPAPPQGTPAGELRAWLSVALGLAGNPIANVTRYGRHDDARMVLTLRDGQRIVYDRQADVFNADALVRRVVLCTGADTPSYGKVDAQRIAAVLVRAADLRDADDDRCEARDWATSFLDDANRLPDVHDMTTPGGRYAGLCALRDWRLANPDPWRLTVAERSVVLVACDGSLYIRVRDFAAHVRGVAGRPIAWSNLHGRMAEIGWNPAVEMEQRQPQGTAKVKLHVYVIPTDWGQS